MNTKFIFHPLFPHSLAPLLIAALFFAPWTVSAVPLATTEIHYSCDDGGNASIGPLPVGLDGACHGSGSYYDPILYHYTFEHQTAASVNTGSGPGFPITGTVHATASADDNGYGVLFYNSGVKAQASGIVNFYFAQEKTGPAPWDPPQLPIYFQAQGEGFATSLRSSYNDPGAGYNAFAVLHVPGFPTDRFSVSGSANGGTSRNSFNSYVYLWLAPNDPLSNPFYFGQLGAACSVSTRPDYWTDENNNLIVYPDSAGCGAAVDPVLRFDQAAFDARYGSDSFQLSDYYSLEISENVVPVPPAVWLFGSGLLGLIGIARRKAR